MHGGYSIGTTGGAVSRLNQQGAIADVVQENAPAREKERGSARPASALPTVRL
jgi:hypothetical protein